MAGQAQQALLAAVLDRLLPAVDELPGAGGLGLAERAPNDPLLDAAPGAVADVLAALPEEFETLAVVEQDEALRTAQDRHPDEFGILINVAYNAYYIDPRVLVRIERLTAYKAGAPQPGGYPIEPFDESILEQTRNRDPFWRKVEP